MNEPQIHLAEQCGLTAGRVIVVGVSGGADSVCLMEALRRAGHAIVVAHFNHRLREGAGDEANVVAGLALRLGVPFVPGEGDVAAAARRSGWSLEAAGRALRYEFLFNLARSRGAQAVAVGHTADDQVETVLMHFLRGAGLQGLAGMSQRTVLRQFDEEIPLVRPLLETWHAETIAFCAANGLRYLEDPSNSSVAFRRNRIRLELLPALEAYNPRIRNAILRMARTIAVDRETLAGIVESAWATALVEATKNRVRLSVSELGRLSPALRANLIRRAIATLDPVQEVDYDATERALALLSTGRAASHVEMKGPFRAARQAGELVVYRGTDARDSPEAPQLPEGVDQIPLDVPGSVYVGTSWIMTSARQPPPDSGEDEEDDPTKVGLADPFAAYLDAATIDGPLELRVRRAGDRFQPLGMPVHSQKLADFMVNAKLPERYRRRWPLLCSGKTVLWVPGYRPAHPCRMTAETEEAICFRLARA